MAGLNTRKFKKKKLLIKNISTHRIPLTQSRIKSIIKKALNYLNADRRWSIGIVFLTDSQIRPLNARYLKHNRPTDVLAFTYSRDNADIAISIETAKKNARVYHTSAGKELTLYLIHGILHILGYDDTTPRIKKIMDKKQTEIFNRIT